MLTGVWYSYVYLHGIAVVMATTYLCVVISAVHGLVPQGHKTKFKCVLLYLYKESKYELDKFKC